MRPVLVTALVATLVPVPARAQYAAVWDSVGRILQASPTVAAGYMRYTFTRQDLVLRSAT